ncbi:hypothetical protein SAY87_019976 [Trapa incisa]|uniref:C3H1-type domain-containing protein n=2 Tax=Trapa TaxID=22665 RepID=A0AAN7LVH3_TRANT|nr:hypothetical protein SAY87_019976 [Trapa incisa]KAK4793305.1 hypothetical protein SAY86_023740 [Trapa natans]
MFFFHVMSLFSVSPFGLSERMPVGKYYCDYCDKEFQDTLSSRKRHIQSIQHIRAKALWYDSILHSAPSESNQSYGEGILRGVCNRFLKMGSCPYGDSCKYIHPKNLGSSGARLPSDNMQQPATIAGTQLPTGVLLQGDILKDTMGMTWSNLPPSLRPPPEGGWPPLPPVEWG